MNELDPAGYLLERALITNGRAYDAPADLREHTLAALGLTGSPGPVVDGTMGWLAAKNWATKVFLVISTASLLVTVPAGYVMLRDTVETEAVPVPPIQIPAGVLTPGVAPPMPFEAPPPGPRVASVAVTSAARALPTGPDSTLRAELAVLDAVRSCLANDDSSGARSFLDAYFRTFPRGRLRLEAKVLRIDVLAQGGYQDLAKQHARAFLRRHPKSILTARVAPYAEL